MIDHDPLCVRWQERDGTYECRCDLIGEVRADERERIAQAIEARNDRYCREIDPSRRLSVTSGYADAARIARGEQQ